MGVTKTFTLKFDTKDAEKDLKGLEKSVDNVNKEVKETSASTSEMTGQLDKLTGGAVSGFKKVTGSLKTVTTGFKSMRVAIMATGIGALVIGILALSAAFKGSEEGQNKFAKIMAVIGALTGNLIDLLADLGEGIISVFENPQQAIKDFSNLIKENITNRFEGLLQLIPNLGKAVEELFKGNFSKAGKIAADSVGKVVLGVDSITDSVSNATDAIKEFTKEQIREGKAAANVADMRAKADKIERNLIVERSKLESEIAQLRLKSRQEDQFTAEERKQALLDAQKLEDSLLDKETQYLELRRDAQIQENTFSRSNKENLTKEAEAIAAVNRQVAARANTARQVQREVNTISKQIEAENKALAAEEKTRQDKIIADEQKRVDAIGKIQEDFVQKQKDLDAETEIEKINLEEERKLAELDRLEATEEQKQEVLDYYSNLRVDAAQKTSDAAIEIAKREEDAKKTALNGYAGAINSLSNTIGQETAAGKGLAIASSLINTYAAITGQLKTAAGSPGGAIPGYAIAQAIATGVAGFAAVKKIASVQVPGGRGATGSSQTGSMPTAPTPPSFNVVGSSGTNQLASAIGGQTKEPLKAFVVSNDVTTAQELERNIISNASIG
tara:strand:- start:1282 stop:3126 length:1845 start_codon:yes stop_codon:yes gene_type:complete